MNIAMIPARIGSQRFHKKNLALIDGRPLITFALESALKSGSFDRVVINGDDESFRQVATEWGVEYYSRPPSLGSSETKSDNVVYDFVQRFGFHGEIVAWVNPVSPLITPDDIARFLDHFHKTNSDSCITTSLKYVHAKYGGHALNYNVSELFARTQDLCPVELFDYALMAWRSSVFTEEFRATGSAFFCGKTTTYELPASRTYHVKTLEDFAFVSALIEKYGQPSNCSPVYYR